jgi:hypothetical protein
MDTTQLVEFLRPILDDVQQFSTPEGDVYGPPVCPDLRAFVRARLGDFCPSGTFEAVLRKPRPRPGETTDTEFRDTVVPKRIALSMLLHEISNCLLENPESRTNRDWIIAQHFNPLPKREG